MNYRGFLPLLLKGGKPKATNSLDIVFLYTVARPRGSPYRQKRSLEFLVGSFPLVAGSRYLSSGGERQFGGGRNGRSQKGKGGGDFVCPKCGSIFRKPTAILCKCQNMQNIF